MCKVTMGDGFPKRCRWERANGGGERDGVSGEKGPPVCGRSSGPAPKCEQRAPGGNREARKHLGLELLFQLQWVSRDKRGRKRGQGNRRRCETVVREREEVDSLRKLVKFLAVRRLPWRFESQGYVENFRRGSVSPNHFPPLRC